MLHDIVEKYSFYTGIRRGFDINTFLQYGVPLGGARPALFDITMTPPAVSSASTLIQYKAMAAQLPAYTTGTVEVPYFGRKIKVAGDRTFADWTITILNDEDFSIRAMMEKWSNDINSLESNVRLSNPIESYKSTDSIVTQFSKFGDVNASPLRQYQLVNCWPNNIEAINLDWDRTNSIETFAVTMSFDYFLVTVQGAATDAVDGTTLSQNG